MNPKRKTQKEAYVPSNGEISLPKVFTMFPNLREPYYKDTQP